MTTPSAESFGALLRKYRTAAQLTQAELAEQASLSVRGINDLERGARTSPRPETVRLLADALVLQAEARRVFLAAARRRPRGPAREHVLTEQPMTAGAVLATDPTAAAESAREAEEPVAIRSFLIADVRGYTNYTVEHGDEQVAQLATRFASLARQVVAAHGGRVLEVRGDEALAVFTSCRHALRAAVALQTVFQQATAEDASLPLPVGIGVDAGEAGPVEEGYRGAALNLAARLCALAKAGETLASETVIGLARRVEGLVYEACEPAVLKGFAEPVRFARVSATLHTADIAAGALTEQAPAPDGVTRPAEPRVQTSMSPPAGAFLGALPEGQLVSREAELERINSALDAVTGGAGRLLLLASEPGVGKTRLAQAAMVAARERGFLIATGRCYEPQMEVPYYPFLETLHHALRQAPTDVWKALGERWPDMVRLLPEEMPGEHGFRLTNLVDARGLGDDRQRLFWQVTRFFQSLAAVHPIALLLDDLHWADEASLDLLAHLARHTRGDRMLLLGVYRDVEVTRRHPLEGALRDLQRERLVERIAVRRLSAEGTRALIGAVLRVEEVSEAFAGLLHGRAEGNPFFTGELLRDLIERGAVFQDGHGRWERHEIGEIAVPEGVRAVIGQRVGRLAADTQEALVAAAVLGQVFAFDELLDMMGRGEEEVESALEEATGAGLIREESGRDQVGGAYAFVHALIQQTLLGELTARRRRKLHRAAGEVLERLPERVRAPRAAELARHYIEATEFARALPYTLQAGDQATALYAHAEAERHYRLAAELSTEQGDAAHEAESREKLAETLSWLDRYEDYRVELERAEVLYRYLDDVEGIRRVVAARSLVERTTDGLAQVKAQLEAIPFPASPGALALCRAAVNLSHHAGLYSDALMYAEQAVGIAREVGDERLQCEVAADRLAGLEFVGRIREARDRCEEVIPWAEHLGNLAALTLALNYAAVLAFVQGDFGASSRYMERLFAVPASVNSPSGLAFLFALRGYIAYWSGDWRQAKDDIEQAIAMCASIDARYVLPSVLTGFGTLRLATYGPDEARLHLERSVTPRQQGLTEYAYAATSAEILRKASGVLAECDILQGDPAAARARLEPFVQPAGFEEHESAFYLPQLAWAYVELGELQQAEATLGHFIEAAREGGARLGLVEALRVLGMLYMRREQWQEAATALEEAFALCHAIPYPYGEGRVLYTYGQLDLQRRETALARERFLDALSILHRLGEQPYAERIELALVELSRS